jgi:hypothetical protein
MGSFTRIYNKFEWWSVADCACEYCLYWKGAKKGCSLTACACEDIRQEALRRERVAKEAAEARLKAKPCPV